LFWPELQIELDGLNTADLLRELQEFSFQKGSRVRVGKNELVNFSSNNYLGLSHHPRVIRKASEALRRWGTGSGASRLLSGNLQIHTDLEKKVASFKNEEAALVFSSGYLANLGAVTALLNDKDLVLLDRLNHASLVDAARLSRAKLWVYPHKNISELDRLLSRAKGFRRRLVLTDAYFSMDGDVAPLDGLLEVCRKRGAMLMIDEAHSTGVYGKNGRGLTEHFRLQGGIDIVMGTLSKALGGVGGYVAGRAVMKEYLVNRCREFIYTTAPSPAASAAAIAALELVEETPSLRERLWNNIHFLREGLLSLGFNLMDSGGPVIPIVIGHTRKTILLRDFLRREGFFAPAIRPPTVPNGTDRIRLSVMADHSKEDLQRLLRALRKAKDKIL